MSVLKNKSESHATQWSTIALACIALPVTVLTIVGFATGQAEGAVIFLVAAIWCWGFTVWNARAVHRHNQRIDQIDKEYEEWLDKLWERV